jgi:hypothetical protein
MAGRLNLIARRVVAIVITAVLASIVASAPASADSDSLLTVPRLGDLFGSRGQGLIVNCGCQRCGAPCNTCPDGQGSSPLGDAVAGDMPGDMGGNAPSGTGQSLERAAAQSEQFGALGSNTMTVNDSAAGYIDNPIVGTWFRLRYDDAANDVRPDRAEFFYAKCGIIGGPGPNGGIANRVDFREVSAYGELKLLPRLSFFTDIPVRWVDIDFAGNGTNSFSGLSDIIAGIKYAMYTDECRYLTFQFKTYAPSGNALQGLGTRHVSLEPGLLYLQRLGNRSYLQGEVRYWIPVGGTDFSGNVIRYGAGFGYDLISSFRDPGPFNPYVSTRGLRLTSVTEFVGWSVLGGRESFADDQGNLVTQSARGDTIVNFKQGVRASLGPRSLYVGWGHALTGSTWYSDLFRIEYRRMF